MLRAYRRSSPIPRGFGMGIALLLHRLGAHRIYAAARSTVGLWLLSWKGLTGPDESLQAADETVVGQHVCAA